MNSFRYPLEEIREKCDLVDIVSAHVALRKRGRTLVGLCPFHNEKTPSFHVMPERRIWKCFGCGEGGDVFSFVQKRDGLTFAEAVEQLARRAGVRIERSDKVFAAQGERERLLTANNVACAFFRVCLDRSSKAREYLERRGLGAAAIEKYRLGYAPASWDSLLQHLTQQKVSTADAVKAGLVKPRGSSQGFYDAFRDRLIFPIFDTSDRVIGFGGRALGDEEPKYLNSPETPLFVKNRTLYGLNFARRAVVAEDRLVIVEGYTDAITCHEAGFENTVATLGTALTEEHVNVIARFTRNVTLAFDADSAGLRAAFRSGPMFEQAGFSVRIISMPEGEDPDSLLRGGDASRFAVLLQKALPIPDFRIRLALAAHDMTSDEGKSAALGEAVAVLAEVESSVERERLIRLLARYHPNFSTGTTLAEDHIRSEVTRARSRTARTARHPVHTDAGKQPAAPTERRLSLVERSERLLLGIMIYGNADAPKVFSALPPNEFSREDTRKLAELVSGQVARTGTIDEGSLRSEAAGTPAEALLLDLAVGLEESEFNHPVDQLVQVIVNQKKSQRLRRMRELARKFEEGAIGRGDEEFEEYYRLLRETAGPRRH